MCGIAGSTLPGPAGLAVVERLLTAMQQRGPDGAGVAGVRHGALGMCRLQVRGGQVDVPFRLAGDGGRVAYNGEIYAT
jgi:asparagine synthetase B (glutamine-hydrolysing)